MVLHVYLVVVIHSAFLVRRFGDESGKGKFSASRLSPLLELRYLLRAFLLFQFSLVAVIAAVSCDGHVGIAQVKTKALAFKY